MEIISQIRRQGNRPPLQLSDAMNMPVGTGPKRHSIILLATKYTFRTAIYSLFVPPIHLGRNVRHDPPKSSNA